MAGALSITVRVARAGDAAELARLATELGYPSEPGEVRARLDALSASEAHAIFVSLDSAGEVSGFLHAALRRQVEVDPFVQIVALVVGEGRRSAGVGAALVRAAETWASSQNVALLRVQSNVTRERAHRFYENLGYERAKTSHIFLKRLGSR